MAGVPRTMTADEHAISRGVGKRVKALRVKAGLSQAQLADKVGVSRNMVSDWEGGRRSLWVDKLVLLADALAVEPCELLIPWVDDEDGTELAVEITVAFQNGDTGEVTYMGEADGD